MSNLKQLRGRIKSIKSTQKITKAMQMVAASKLKKLKDKLVNPEAYLSTLQQACAIVARDGDLSDLNNLEKAFFARADLTKPVLLIAITSNRGLCGSFNSIVVKKVKQDIAEFEKTNQAYKLIILGKKGYDAFKARYASYIYKYFDYDNSAEQEGQLLTNLYQIITNLIENGQIASCYLYYNKFKNAIAQILTKSLIFPIVIEQELKLDNYEFEGANLYSKVIELYIKGYLSFGLLESRAGEEGARMTAMDNATKNANELVDKLTLKLNRSRQAIITSELTEIIAGAEAI